MDKGARRRSKRRSVRLLKSVTVTGDDEDQLNTGSEVYGTVWLSENDNIHSPSHRQNQKLRSLYRSEGNTYNGLQPPPSCSESSNLHSVSTCQNNLSQGHSESDDKLQASCPGESDTLYSSHAESEVPQSSYPGESDRLCFSHTESKVHQASCSGESDRLYSSALTENERLHFPLSKESNRLLSPHLCIESDKLQSLHIKSDRLQFYNSTHACSNSLPSPSSHRLLSPPSLNNVNESDICQSLSHNENDRLRASNHKTPKAKAVFPDQAAVGALHFMSTCHREMMLTSTDDKLQCASCTSQIPHSDADCQVKSPLTTPVSHDFECEMDSETSLDKGFFCLEQSSLCLDSSAGTTTPVVTGLQAENTSTTPVTTRLQLEDSVCSSAGLECSENNMLDHSDGSNTATQQSLEKEVTSSSVDVPVSLITPQTADNSEMSDSAFTLVAVPVSSSAERLESALIASPAHRHTVNATDCAPTHQSEDIGCGSVGRMNSSDWECPAADDIGADVTDQKEVNLWKPTSRTLDTDISQDVMDTDQPESTDLVKQKHNVEDQSSENLAIGNSECNSCVVGSFSIFSSDMPLQDHAHAGSHSAELSKTLGSDTQVQMTASNAQILDSDITSNKQSDVAIDGSDTCGSMIMAHTSQISQLESSDKNGELNLSWSPQPVSQENRQKETTSSRKIKKQRRRSAFGAELKLETFTQQGAATATSYPIPTISQQNCVDQTVDSQYSYPTPINDRKKTEPSLIKTSHENSVSPLQDQSVGRQADDLMKPGITCVEECSDPKEPTQQESITKRRKRRSSQALHKEIETSMNAEDAQDHDEAGADDNMNAFTKRRSSIRLSLRLCRKSAQPVSSSVDENENVSNKPLPPVGTAAPVSPQPGCSIDVCTEPDKPDFTTIPPELEQLYRNKNFKRPANKTWETIFECPSRGKVTGKQKLKRYIQFEDSVPVSKLKRRLKKAAENGWRCHVKKSATADKNLLARLEELDREISDD